MECGILNGDRATLRLNMGFSRPIRSDSGILPGLSGSLLATRSCLGGDPVRSVLTARVCILHWLGSWRLYLVLCAVSSCSGTIDCARLVVVGWVLAEADVNCDLRGDGD
ncbi:uncharacterized protein PpBr36_10540 [Pyricularia pennisetigena]|uniref:uncharacterized protein n=1 Tax=Pyricularia pennisetigena TaxID=1578925 RepID=UPI00114DCD2F|nr:uncharacterized protein PpBr36_10540 [Pyricularia pennisetigena]TLS21264.1 hypothetical protein PpBr36_10540 [Pyricularia pennisetigena]